MKKRIYFIFLALFIAVSQLVAQNEKQIRIAGKVSDKITGEPIPGVTVSIKGSKTGVITLMDGTYSIMVPKSTIDLVYTFIGYETETIAINDKRNIDIVLKSAVKELGELEITAQAKGQMAARQQQINSNTIVNVVSAERLRENPDANAVEAIGRLPGISVDRSGGEGVGLKIRGLGGGYTHITMNGVDLPATGSDRSTSISGIPQNMLQGVEVYKSLTADMAANSVAGTINLKLREAPKGFHYDVLAQGGYNHLNNDYGNYKFTGEISNRFFKDKLGVYFTGNIERVNRSIEDYSAGYDNNKTTDPVNHFYLNSTNYNMVHNIKYRKSASIAFDYRLSSSTKLSFYSMFNYNNDDYESQSKSYSAVNTGGVGYNFSKNNLAYNILSHNSFSGETNLKFLNLSIEYGASYSESLQEDPDSRSWNFSFTQPLISKKLDTNLTHTLNPLSLAPLYKDNDSLQLTQLFAMNKYSRKSTDKNKSGYVDVKLPFKFGEFSGYIKLGGKYSRKDRYTKILTGNLIAVTNIDFQNMLKASQNQFDWVHFNSSNNMSILGLVDHNVNDFMQGNGNANFGWAFNLYKMNQLADWWDATSKYYWNLGPTEYLKHFGSKNRLYYNADIGGSTYNNEDISENYLAGYMMSEINYKKWLMFLPGVRLETVHTKMNGTFLENQSTPYNMLEQLPGTPTSVKVKNEYLLPMIHLKITPTNKFFIHIAYTQTLNRPNFSDISPNTFIYSGFAGNAYTAKNPYLKPELWTNLDAQFTFHAPKIGLLSITPFYKSVKDKIWYWNYKRIKGDTLIPTFKANDVVDVSVVRNHDFDIFLKGIEFEWQTSFYYLPGLLKYFVLNLNYSFTDSQTKYYAYDIVPGKPDPITGRPGSPVRNDYLRTDKMSGMPQNVGNASLGFEKKRFKAYLSYQYTSQIYSIDARIPVRDGIKNYFNRWDMQLSYSLPLIKLKSKLFFVADIANISNKSESSHTRGDSRPTYVEAYGWTADFGIRYKY